MPKFAIGLPNIGEYADARLLADLAAESDAAGWDGFFIWDHVVYRDRDAPLVDPWAALIAIALATSRVRIGVLMASVARRRPHVLARQAATVDVVSDGRLTFGAALGSMPEEYDRFGEDPDPRVRAQKLDEGLEAITGLWTGEPFSYRGEHVVVDDIVMRPTPVQRPRPPVWIGGSWPNTKPFVRAASWDGVMPIHVSYGHGRTMPAKDLETIVAFISQQRDISDGFDIALEGESASWDDVEPYADVGLTWWVEKLGWWRGTLDDTRRRIAQGPPASND